MGESADCQDPERRHGRDQDGDEQGCVDPCRRSRRKPVEGTATDERCRERDDQWQRNEVDHLCSLSNAARLAASSGSSLLANPASADSRSVVASSNEWILRAVTSASVCDA